MRVIKDHKACPTELRCGVVALGNFDGFHRGHQAVIGEAGRIARAHGQPLLVLTTDPHPRRFFAPNADRFVLTPSNERVFLLERFGADGLALLPFDDALSQTTAEDFVDTILVAGLGVKHVVVGYDYHFGKGRKGNVEVLKHLGESRGFEVHVLSPVSVGVEGAAGEVYSSTLVREALKAGEPRRSAALLGHWWAIEGVVEKGDQRGRTIDFPTANIQLGETISPKYGVYAVRAEDVASGRVYEGVANIGIRPTTSNPTERLEAYLFDFSGDLYDKTLRVELVGFVRAERKFEDFEALKAQIHQDVDSAKLILADPDNARGHFPFPTLDSYLRLYPDPLI